MSTDWRSVLADRPWIARVVSVGVVGTVMFGCIGVCIGFPCFPTGIRYGMWVDECPDTDMRLGANVSLQGVLRGEEGWIEVAPYARYLEGRGVGAWVRQEALRRGFRTTLTLLDDEGQEVEGFEVRKWERSGAAKRTEVVLPEVPDGDYTLHAEVRAPFETIEVDVPLPLYAPAIAHVATDRPLYKPGQEVLFRSVLLDRTDLEPLDGRPGRWRVKAPDGTEMLVEKDRAGSFGVADSSFPLDARADIGTWSVTWDSGGTSDTVEFDVRPFKLPRLTVDLTPSETWYGISDEVVVRGLALYTSGAPVANAPVVATLGRVDGRWPPPVEWEEPLTATTDAAGRFTLELGRVPPDLIEKATLSLVASVTEEAGEVARGRARLVMSKDDLSVEAVTEFGDGLVGDFNNRAYLRVTRPDGVPLRDTDIVVSNPWKPEAKVREAHTDADGVAAIQLDPGDPVTVVIPAPPVRERPVEVPPPSLTAGHELASGRALSMAERKALDGAVGAVARCGDFAVGGRTVTLGLRVSGSGAVGRVLHGDSPAEACVADAMRRVRFRPGPERTLTLSWNVPDTLRPSLAVSNKSAWGDASRATSVLNLAAVRARRCMERGQGVSGSTVMELHWSTTEDSTALGLSTQRSSGSGLSPTAMACVMRTFQGLRLDEPARDDALGAASVRLNVPRPGRSAAPQATTKTGYELQVAAMADGESDGETRLVLPTGSIPPLRLRATPSLASPGDEVLVEMFRGPDFYGDLPEWLYLYEGTIEVARAEVDEATRSVRFQVPESVDGFLYVETHGARVVIYVQPRDRLEVALSTDRQAYRPGDEAQLTVHTTAGGQPTPAGVGLIGVDKALSQLAPLLGPDDYGRVTVRTTADQPAFGAFDPRALVLGEIRGENAAKAAVLRISTLPMDAAGDEPVYGSASALHDDEQVLTTSFYRALERLVDVVREWEQSAPEGEVMSPAQMVAFWKRALEELETEGTPAVDAYGRPLSLDVLPDELLVQADPRQVVADATRLPEDVVSWTRYIDEEVR